MTWKSRHKTGSPHPQEHRSALRTKPKPRKVSGYISVSFYEYKWRPCLRFGGCRTVFRSNNLDSVAREATLWKRRRCRHPHSTKSECGGMLKVRFKRHSFRRCVGMRIQKRKTLPHDLLIFKIVRRRQINEFQTLGASWSLHKEQQEGYMSSRETRRLQLQRACQAAQGVAPFVWASALWQGLAMWFRTTSAIMATPEMAGSRGILTASRMAST